MNTILIILLKENVSATNLDKFFSFIDPFIEKQGFQLINSNPKIYINNANISDANIRSLITKIKGQNNYNQIVKSSHFGKLNKL